MYKPVPVGIYLHTAFPPYDTRARRGDTPDTVKFVSEALAKGLPQQPRRCRVGRQQQFIVLAAAYGGTHIATDGRNRLDVYLGAARRCTQYMAQIRRQTVREIHHGMHLAAAAKPLSLCRLGRRITVEVCQRCIKTSRKYIFKAQSRAAQLTRNEYLVTDASRRTAFDMRGGAAANGYDIYRNSAL